MAQVGDLPCDGDGICMICKTKPLPDDSLSCKTCATPWHIICLSSRPDTLADALQWDCPDCSMLNPTSTAVGKSEDNSSDLISAIRAIESDVSLTEPEKAKRRQQLLGGGGGESGKEKINCTASGSNEILDILDAGLNCSFCMQLPDRPVTTPCGHNFCLKCFQKWIGQGKRTCANCRNQIPAKMASQPRINSALVIAIRMAKMSKSNTSGRLREASHFVHNQNRPDKAYTTERAKRAGKSNACSGKIFVTVPPDHFGPILVENDPVRNQGVLVGESWEDRLECRQWGAHLPHVAGIAGQSSHGAQSVALSGGYVDDEDHGEWFLYTGSGGRDLSGNKRTNKEQSFDQTFEKMNEALRLSCRKGYPLRVVRSHKEKRSSYAPEVGVRYDGIYRIEKCWRKIGIQGYKVCRYLFVRCDNEPAPWTSDDHGDRPRPLPAIGELENAVDVTERRVSPSWDYDEEKGCWMWKKPPPTSKKQVAVGNGEDGKKMRKSKGRQPVGDKLLKELSCQICRKVMSNPLTTPCAHNFCKACLEDAFAGQSFTRQRTCQGTRTLRVQKSIMKCPACTNDIAEFLQNPQVNRELMGVIEALQQRNKVSEDSDTVADAEMCNMNGEVLQEANGNILGDQSEIEQSDGVDGETVTHSDESEKGDCNEQPATTEFKQNCSRKRDNDVGDQLIEDAQVPTRGKRVKVTVTQ
ncbi:E3 ubiquitin-protein ligase ORTHRUS 2-like [Mercurialis annua]|uniref:E3 ubiquitin-protein ligase ORTHRUS 2-like n=1 Tax=Mercurialis annua TaxID=3986 RepID=UPI00215F8C72|nr:E3 ubiquitin-protein ligase ORTHRUS 2-like [Mercurialis annua]